MQRPVTFETALARNVAKRTPDVETARMIPGQSPEERATAGLYRGKLDESTT
jgi:hypothetical protein